jgi:hypothetical protein
LPLSSENAIKPREINFFRMAKGTLGPALVNVSGPFGAQTRPEAKRNAQKVSIAEGNQCAVIKSRSNSKKPPSAAQKKQREKYSDCDCLWKNRDTAQKAQWEAYIGVGGLTAKPVTDSYRVFMSHCLKWDLVEYFRDYLFAEWEVLDVQFTPNYVLVIFNLGSTLDDPPDANEFDPELLLNRII